MKILIVSYESWRDTNNGGNVLSNVFSAFPDAEIAQIYCCGELPQNAVCQNYFQIADTMLLTKEKGRRLEVKDYSTAEIGESGIAENKVKSKIPSVFRESVLLARELLWVCFRWKTKQLDDFVQKFKPDIIFAPCYSYFHISQVALYVKQVAKCPMISYISDDNYSLKQFRFSPSFWINRLITRKWIRRHFAACSLVYTMTDMQKMEYEALFGCPMKVLCKSAEFEECEREIGNPVQFIYAGGLYLNRWKVLAKLSKALEVANKAEIKGQLHIFSGSKLSAGKEKQLHDGRNVFLHGAVPYSALVEQYKKSDVAVHVESFDLKNRCITRLSFSTKIIDCMNSGCAILAIGPSTQAGMAYLKENDAAICISDMKELNAAVEGLISNPGHIRQYSAKANELGRKNHSKQEIEYNLRQDFCSIAAQDYGAV